MGGLLSGAGVGDDLRRIKQVFAPADAGAEGVQLATRHEVAHGAVGHAEHAGSFRRGQEEPARRRLGGGYSGGKVGGGRHERQWWHYSMRPRKSDAPGAGYDTMNGKRGKTGKSGKIGKRGKSGSGASRMRPVVLCCTQTKRTAHEQRKTHHY